MSDSGEPSPEGGDPGRAAQEREWAELQQDLLRDEVLRRKEFREIFEAHEKVIAEKVRQLRTERGWSQDDLARRMEDLGWPMHQTTVAKLEAARRPIRAGEVYALAMVFGLPIQALWYLPVPGEPWPMERMREEFQQVEDRIAATEQALNAMFKIYADQKTERIQLSRVLNDVAKSASDSPGPRDFDPDILREMAEALEEKAGSARRMAARGVTESEARALGRAHARAQDPELAELAAEVRSRHDAGESLQSIAESLAGRLPPHIKKAADLAVLGTIMNPETMGEIIVRFENRGDGLLDDDQAQVSPEGKPGEGKGA